MKILTLQNKNEIIYSHKFKNKKKKIKKKKNTINIAELFPNVVTESMGKDGQLHKAIDFDKLKFLLTANQAEMGVVYDDDERYELTWVGKKQAIREVAHPIRKTLRPCPEESRNWVHDFRFHSDAGL